jgi:chloramphenicol 3-O phosphotransferase
LTGSPRWPPGACIILVDVFLGGAKSQERVRKHLGGLEVLWVGVRCDAEVAATRNWHAATR